MSNKECTMKKINILLLLIACIVSSCSMTGQLKRSKAWVNISLPNSIQEESKAENENKKRSVLEFTDLKGKKTTYATTEKDQNGKQQITVELRGVTVVAKSRTVPERFGKVNIDFVVSVPEKLIRKNRQLVLTPFLLKKDQQSPFNDLVFNGSRFYQRQRDDYKKYEKFLSQIIPDSAFSEKLINQKAYRKQLFSYDRSQRRKESKDSLEWRAYNNYLANTHKRYNFFNRKMVQNRIWLRKLLGYPLIRERYELFDRDTIYVSLFFEKRYETIARLFPEFHLVREMSDKTMPKKYRAFQGKVRYSYRSLSQEDSVSILKRYWRYKKIFRNERLKKEKEQKFEELVRFPRNIHAHLDTVINHQGRMLYYYHQEVTTDENSKQMKLFLNGYVQNTNKRKYQLPSSDTLTYVLSSMIQFMDLTPRFQQKIIERKAMSSVKAYITFESGKSELVESLGQNQKEIKRIAETAEKLTDTGEFLIDSITLIAGSSPEGSFKTNLQLSKARALSLKKYLRTKLKEVKGIDTLLKARWRGEDWDNLVRLVNETASFYPKGEILKLLDKAVQPDLKEKILKNKYPTEYTIIRKDLYPQLRAVDFTFSLHRAGMIQDTIHTTEPDTLYASAIELMQQRKYSKALTILSSYNDWNTAICLMSLGYDESACTILQNEKLTADRQYLLAILFSRLNREEQAISYYRQACELDESKRWRGALDPEINRLVRKYDLNKEK
jgi:Outer membrane protein and related peptidoglycan-associated (lipo)proteins